jgi:hypothetical protein
MKITIIPNFTDNFTDNCSKNCTHFNATDYRSQRYLMSNTREMQYDFKMPNRDLYHYIWRDGSSRGLISVLVFIKEDNEPTIEVRGDIVDYYTESVTIVGTERPAPQTILESHKLFEPMIPNRFTNLGD